MKGTQQQNYYNRWIVRTKRNREEQGGKVVEKQKQTVFQQWENQFTGANKSHIHGFTMKNLIITETNLAEQANIN